MTATHLESVALLLETQIVVDDPCTDLPECAEARQMVARPYGTADVDVPFTEAEAISEYRTTDPRVQYVKALFRDISTLTQNTLCHKLGHSGSFRNEPADFLAAHATRLGDARQAHSLRERSAKTGLLDWRLCAELLFDLCSGPGLTLDATGPGSAVYIVAEQPRRAVSDKCVFMVRANNSDGVVISMQKMKLRRSTAVDGICLDYVEVSA
ncbi:hypothetical protein MRX96_022322 [Rhipicephalus microplus]